MAVSTSRSETEADIKAPHAVPAQGDYASQLSASPLFRFPSLTTTVPREFVHRAAVAEVILTDWRRAEDGETFLVSAQWPRGHSFFHAIGDHHDPLLVAETIRQAGTLLAHAEFGVPLGHAFVMWDLEFTVEPERLRTEAVPAALEIEVVCEPRWRNGKLTALGVRMRLLRDGLEAAAGSGSLTCTSAAVYRRLRGEQGLSGASRRLPLTAPVAPQYVGRLDSRDVVLTPIGEESRWQLRVDTRHPVLFDHPVDHVPGMVLVEAARQAAASVLGRREFLPLGMVSRFHRYAELDAPSMIEAVRLEPDAAGREQVRVTGHQSGELLFGTTVLGAPDRR